MLAYHLSGWCQVALVSSDYESSHCLRWSVDQVTHLRMSRPGHMVGRKGHPGEAVLLLFLQPATRHSLPAKSVQIWMGRKRPDRCHSQYLQEESSSSTKWEVTQVVTMKALLWHRNLMWKLWKWSLTILSNWFWVGSNSDVSYTWVKYTEGIYALSFKSLHRRIFTLLEKVFIEEYTVGT